LCLAHLTGFVIDDVNGRTTVIDEQLLASLVLLPHTAFLPPGPSAVKGAIATVLVGSIAVDYHILRPQQLQGHALAL
jgi:hypothetical protein